MSDSKPKPCPLCGNSDLWIGYNSPGFDIRCSCGLELDVHLKTEEETVEKWNSRAKP